MNKLWCMIGWHDYVVVRKDNIPAGGGWGNTIKDEICIRCAKKNFNLTKYYKRRTADFHHQAQRFKIAKRLINEAERND